MKDQLTESERAALLPHIQAVLDGGKEWEDKSMHHPVEAIVNEILLMKGVERKPLGEDARYGIDGFDTNGWHWDWWQYFTYKGKSYALTGSGYYGGHTFGLSDE